MLVIHLNNRIYLTNINFMFDNMRLIYFNIYIYPQK
jgi:hypothetical protein